MSVSTPSLTTSSEIWAEAVPVKAASVRATAATVASVCMFLFPVFLFEGFAFCGPVLDAFAHARKARRPLRNSSRDDGNAGGIGVLQLLFSSPLPACGERSPRSCAAGEGESPRTVLLEAAPHPNPLPVRTGRGSSTESQLRQLAHI